MKKLTPSNDHRRKAVDLVVGLTANTHLAPLRYERQLLRRSELGELTTDQIDELMNATIYQLLYHSQAVIPMDRASLQHLLDRARAHNNQHGITGLLLYSNGRFVQLLEGRKEEIQRLFHNIRLDARHLQVTTVIEGLGPQLYADWNMAFGYVAGEPLDQTLTAIQVASSAPISSVFDPHLRKLLQLFI